jgi:trehalose 6-phosphate synthase/phosphatase
LPVTVRKCGKRLEYIDSIGGLSTGLSKYHNEADSIWVGWPGISQEELSGREKRSIEKTLKEKYKCLPVFLTQEEVGKYYHGFCNNTIWPLFHYFSSQTQYDISTWEAYNEVNQKFYERIRSSIGKKDTVWIHDYQLMLLPEIIKRHHPFVQVGFFLHIPFPSAELFRLLVWREDILRGLLGADLIGFHTYDYVRHFLSCTRRLLGLDDNLNIISYEDRYVKVDSFPMGIDYNRFAGEVDESNLSPEVLEIKKIKENKGIILSIDRLDYTKGIPARIRAYNNFLVKYPEYRGKVRLNLIVAPSRTEIENYELLLKEIRELVSETNGTFGTMNWMPIWFLFKSFSQEELMALYRNSDVLLVTPLRDGMNLIAKEYVASRTDYGGMLVLSETAGAASELAEAVIVNANDADSVAQGIKTALEMTKEEKIARNKVMHQRLQRYTVEVWAEDFLRQLRNTCEDAEVIALPRPIETIKEHLEKDYVESEKRILFLDYDGTLVGFKAIPEQAVPDQDLKDLLHSLCGNPKNTIVLISGRDRKILDTWFSGIEGLHLIASHGLWLKHPGQKWTMTATLDNQWKDSVRPVFQLFADRMPGAIVEEKEFALSLHYRRCNPDMVVAKLNELKETLVSMTKSSSLVIQEGSKVLELKDSKVNKGTAASLMIDHNGYDFLFGAGDDLTDEDTFRVLPQNAYVVKVGLGRTAAQYRTKSWLTMRKVLKRFVELD